MMGARRDTFRSPELRRSTRVRPIVGLLMGGKRRSPAQLARDEAATKRSAEMAAARRAAAAAALPVLDSSHEQIRGVDAQGAVAGASAALCTLFSFCAMLSA